MSPRKQRTIKKNLVGTQNLKFPSFWRWIWETKSHSKKILSFNLPINNLTMLFPSIARKLSAVHVSPQCSNNRYILKWVCLGIRRESIFFWGLKIENSVFLEHVADNTGKYSQKFKLYFTEKAFSAFFFSQISLTTKENTRSFLFIS